MLALGCVKFNGRQPYIPSCPHPPSTNGWQVARTKPPARPSWRSSSPGPAQRVTAGLTLGVLRGLASGVSMGFGSYGAMPIPLFMATVWCLGTLIINTVASLLTGLIVREDFRPRGSAAQNLEK